MKAFIYTLAMISLIGHSATADGKLMIDRFNDNDNRSEQGGWWYTYDDSNRGGNSQCAPLPDQFKPAKSEDEQGYAARLTGLTGTKLGWDYFGMGVTLTKDSGCPDPHAVDISKYSTLEFKMKGNASAGRLIVMILYTEDKCDGMIPVTKTAWADYQAAVTSDLNPDWTTVKLDLRKDFAQPHWAKTEHVFPIEEVLKKAHVIQWHFYSADGDTLDLWIDDIMLY